MPLDAICLRALTNELKGQLLGARIDKVQQPARDQVVLLLRGNLRLLLNAGPNQPRVQLTEVLRENPAEPPMLCMLLRKHLVGARITDIEQSGLERIVTFTVRNVNELGESGTRRLVLEAMGRRSNLLLLDEDGRILDCMRRVELETSSARALLPGLFYQLPAPLEKVSLLDDPAGAAELARRGGGAEESVERFLLDHYLGISPLIARELSHRAFGASDARFADHPGGCERLAAEIERLAERVQENRFTPTMLSREGKPVDFTYCPITQYGAETAQTSFPSFSALLDAFYTERDRQEAAQRRGRELTRTVNSAHERVVRKLGMLEKEYAAAQDRDALRLCGDLITANLYRMERGAARLTAQNYYDENGAEIDIPLDPLLTPQQNAAKYYKRYTKAKTAEKHLREQIDKAIAERDYLESVQGEIALSQTESEFAELRRELQETGYLRRSGKEKRGREKPVAPREFRSSSGLHILVGRSNVQNDALTRKADKRDLWLHTQKIHGSHVILCTENGAYDDASLHEAALLAAYYSQARDGSNVPVDYTSVKFVKKPANAKPGMVVYEPYRTVYVTPDEESVRRLEKKNK
ncbi:NFACT family protein [Oscillibacter valericigenes]|nr:NFACT family protein [Oscillibacter valericigenes]